MKSFREIYRGFPVFCKFFDFRASGIRQPQNARDFVECFADGVVLRRANDFYVVVPDNFHDCGVSARRKQAKIRRFQRFVRDIVCRNVPPDVIDLNQRHVHCVRKRFRIRYADKQRAQKSRSVRYRHGGYVGKRHVCLLQRFINGVSYRRNVIPACDFRDNPAESLVNLDLRRYDKRQYVPAARYRRRRFVATRLYRKNKIIVLVLKFLELFCGDFFVH